VASAIKKAGYVSGFSYPGFRLAKIQFNFRINDYFDLSHPHTTLWIWKCDGYQTDISAIVYHTFNPM
jgi:hypothetical protein